MREGPAFRWAFARPIAVLIAAALLAALSGCGGGELDGARDRFGGRIREVLADLEKVFPSADRTSPTIRSRGRNEPTTIDAFLSELLQDIDRYLPT